MDALVLGGGRDDALARSYGAPSKAFLPVAGRPMAAWVLRALKEGGVGRVAFVGPRGPLDPAPDLWLRDRDDLLANVEEGLSALAAREPVLVATADVPLLTSEAVAHLLREAPAAGLVYPIVPKEAVEARFPGMKRTYARLREGTFTGGNLVLLDPELFRRALPTARKVVAWRKNPLRLALLFGPAFLLKLLFGALSVAELEARAEGIFGVPMRAMVVPYPEIGVDVDKPEDVAFAERALTEGDLA